MNPALIAEILELANMAVPIATGLAKSLAAARAGNEAEARAALKEARADFAKASEAWDAAAAVKG